MSTTFWFIFTAVVASSVGSLSGFALLWTRLFQSNFWKAFFRQQRRRNPASLPNYAQFLVLQGIQWLTPLERYRLFQSSQTIHALLREAEEAGDAMTTPTEPLDTKDMN